MAEESHCPDATVLGCGFLLWTKGIAEEDLGLREAYTCFEANMCSHTALLHPG